MTGDYLTETLRRAAAQMHRIADRNLADCDQNPACDACQAWAEHARNRALGFATRAVRQDLIAREVNRG